MFPARALPTIKAQRHQGRRNLPRAGAKRRQAKPTRGDAEETWGCPSPRKFFAPLRLCVPPFIKLCCLRAVVVEILISELSHQDVALGLAHGDRAVLVNCECVLGG